MKSRDERCFSEIAVEPVAEHVELGGHRRLHDEPLALVDDLGEGRSLVDEPGVDPLHGPRLAAVDEDAVQEVEELVAGGAAMGPVAAAAARPGQDLLGHDERRPRPRMTRRVRHRATRVPRAARKYSAGA